MVNWRVDVLNQSVVEEIDDLPPDMRAKLDHIVRMIEELGLHQVREPYIKALRGKLWEIRITGSSGKWGGAVSQRQAVETAALCKPWKNNWFWRRTGKCSQLFFHRSHSAWKTLSHRGCWPGSTSLGVSHSPHRLYYGY